MNVWCPYPGCDFTGTDDEVDDHRANNHKDEAQQGSNLRTRAAGRGPIQATQVACPNSYPAIGMTATHHLAPRGNMMVCIYCWKTQAEILRDLGAQDEVGGVG